MNKEFIPYEQALELKELGFNEECMAIYFVPTKELLIGKKVNEYTTDIRVYAPLYQQVFRWFREKNYRLSINWDYEYDAYWFHIWHLKSEKENTTSVAYGWKFDYESGITLKTYEEAELECLKKLIEIAKDKPQKQGRIQDISIG